MSTVPSNAPSGFCPLPLGSVREFPAFFGLTTTSRQSTALVAENANISDPGSSLEERLPVHLDHGRQSMGLGDAFGRPVGPGSLESRGKNRSSNLQELSAVVRALFKAFAGSASAGTVRQCSNSGLPKQARRNKKSLSTAGIASYFGGPSAVLPFLQLSIA